MYYNTTDDELRIYNAIMGWGTIPIVWDGVGGVGSPGADYCLYYNTANDEIRVYDVDRGDWGTIVITWDEDENFTTWTEYDIHNNLSQTPTVSTFTNVTRTYTCLLAKDCGVGFFSGNFEILLTTQLTSATEEGFICVFVLSKTGILVYRQQPPWTTVEINLYRRTNPAQYEIQLGEWIDGNWYNDIYICAAGTPYYLKLERVGDVLSLFIYSDEARTNLLDTLSITLQSIEAYRYAFAPHAADTDVAGLITGWVSGLSNLRTTQSPGVDYGLYYNTANHVVRIYDVDGQWWGTVEITWDA